MEGSNSDLPDAAGVSAKQNHKENLPVSCTREVTREVTREDETCTNGSQQPRRP